MSYEIPMRPVEILKELLRYTILAQDAEAIFHNEEPEPDPEPEAKDGFSR